MNYYVVEIAVNFEDLKVWQEARDIAKEVYFFIRDIRDYGYNTQIQRTSVSVIICFNHYFLLSVLSLLFILSYSL